MATGMRLLRRVDFRDINGVGLNYDRKGKDFDAPSQAAWDAGVRVPVARKLMNSKTELMDERSDFRGVLDSFLPERAEVVQNYNEVKGKLEIDFSGRKDSATEKLDGQGLIATTQQLEAACLDWTSRVENLQPVGEYVNAAPIREIVQRISSIADFCVKAKPVSDDNGFVYMTELNTRRDALESDIRRIDTTDCLPRRDFAQHVTNGHRHTLMAMEDFSADNMQPGMVLSWDGNANKFATSSIASTDTIVNCPDSGVTRLDVAVFTDTTGSKLASSGRNSTTVVTTKAINDIAPITASANTLTTNADQVVSTASAINAAIPALVNIANTKSSETGPASGILDRTLGAINATRDKMVAAREVLVNLVQNVPLQQGKAQEFATIVANARAFIDSAELSNAVNNLMNRANYLSRVKIYAYNDCPRDGGYHGEIWNQLTFSVPAGVWLVSIEESGPGNSWSAPGFGYVQFWDYVIRDGGGHSSCLVVYVPPLPNRSPNALQTVTLNYNKAQAPWMRVTYNLLCPHWDSIGAALNYMDN